MTHGLFDKPIHRDIRADAGSPSRARRIVHCALSGLVLLAGCATTPLEKLAEPRFEMPERFEHETGDAPLAAAWWQAFDDPALNTLIRQALDDNFTLASAYARLIQARASLAGARADLFPTLDASLEQSATRRPDRSDDRGDAPLDDNLDFDRDTSNWSDTRTLGFAAAYELDLWGRLRNARNAARFELQSSAADLQSAAVTLVGDLAGSWYRLQELVARIELLESQIETNRNVLDLTTFAFKNGLADAADVLRQRQAIEAVRGRLEQTRASRNVVEHALALLVGQPPQQFEAPTGKLIELPPLPETGVPAEVLMRRPDVRQQFYALAAADRRVAVAVAARYPQVSLSANVSASSDSGDLFSNWITQLAANITQPIFDAGARAAEVERSEAVAAEALALYQQTLLEALAETDDALTNEYRQQRFIAHLETQLDLSERTVANLRLRYLRGATEYLDVLDALLTRQNLQVDYLTARRQLIDYRINLYRALAGNATAQPAGPAVDAPPVPLRPGPAASDDAAPATPRPTEQDNTTLP